MMHRLEMKQDMWYHKEGNCSITYELPSDTYTVGKKRFLITDNVDGDVTEATTSADAFFYAQGAINTDLNGETFIRPPVVKRVSSTSNNTRLENLNELFNATSDATLNTINPIYQIFSVDPTGFPNGAFIKKVRLWFDEPSDTGTPIQLSIRPVIDGVPSSSIIIPFSEKVQSCVDDEVTTDPSLFLREIFKIAATHSQTLNLIHLCIFHMVTMHLQCHRMTLRSL